MGNKNYHVQSCVSCPIRGVCGGIDDDVGPLLSCQLLCGNACDETGKGECVYACPNNPKRFYTELSEVKAFDYLPQIRIRIPERRHFPLYVPQLHHGYRRQGTLKLKVGCAAIAIADLLQYASREKTAAAIRLRFGLDPQCEIVAVGVAKDDSLEDWWRNSDGVEKILHLANVAAVTVPNFSIFEGSPRFQSLINIARIHHFSERLTRAKLPTIPHIYAQNSADWERWRKLFTNQSQIRLFAVEFQTALGIRGNGLAYIRELENLQKFVNRPLHPIVIGGAQYVAEFDRIFDDFTIIDSQPFMKTLYRRGLSVIPPFDSTWIKRVTPRGQGLDGLLAENIALYSERLLARRRSGPTHLESLAA